MEKIEEVKRMLDKRVSYIINHSGAGKEAMDVIVKAFREDNIFDNLAEYFRFITFFCYQLKCGDRDKYPLCNNTLYALEQINVFKMMKVSQ